MDEFGELSQEAFDSALETFAVDEFEKPQRNATPNFAEVSQICLQVKEAKQRKFTPNGIEQLDEYVPIVPTKVRKVTSPPQISRNSKKQKVTKPKASKVLRVPSSNHNNQVNEKKKSGRPLCPHSKRKNEHKLNGYIRANCLDQCRSLIKQCCYCFEWANYNNFYRHVEVCPATSTAGSTSSLSSSSSAFNSSPSSPKSKRQKNLPKSSTKK
mmetsp:Transcript_16056/g.18988  ORF Transcript_16056/g.18988 Transcript_16056/m.18988 type:complete len:212 (-) Transcript_16056:60-695(-)